MPSNVLLVREDPETVPHVFMVQSQSTVLALFYAVRTSSASKDSVLPAQKAVTDANIPPKTALLALMVTSKLGLFVRRAV